MRCPALLVSSLLWHFADDSMHGAVTPNNRFLNDVIGAMCVSLYAWFDYGLMVSLREMVGMLERGPGTCRPHLVAYAMQLRS